MTAYIILVALSVLLGLLIAASIISIVCRGAFKAELTPAPLPPPDTSGNLLSYAPPPPRIGLMRRFPWLAAIVGFAPAAVPLLVLTIALVAPLLLEFLPGFFTASAAGAWLLFLSLYLVLCWRAFRRPEQDRPAAASWPKWRFIIAGLLVLVTMGLTLFAFNLKAHRDLRRFSNLHLQTLREMRIAVPEGSTRAADLYAKAFSTYDPNAMDPAFDWDSDPDFSSAAPTAPPPFPAAQQETVAILLEAAALPVADFADPAAYTLQTLRPHPARLRESTRILRLHAIVAAHAGNLSMTDIAAMRAIARHAGEGVTLIDCLVAIGIDAIANATIEELLPMATSEQQLNEIPWQKTGWHQAIAQRTLPGEEASTGRAMASILAGEDWFLTGKPNAAQKAMMAPWRIFFLRPELQSHQAVFGRAIERASRMQPGQPLPAITSSPIRGPLTRILVPSTDRAIAVCHAGDLRQQLAQLGVAATRYRLRHGHLPTSFDDLLRTKLIASIPTDPFNAGQPIKAIFTPELIRFYSIGQNGIDEKGAAPINSNTDDIVFRVSTKPLWLLPFS